MCGVVRPVYGDDRKTSKQEHILSVIIVTAEGD